MNLLHTFGCSGIGLAGSLLMSSVLAQSDADTALAERLASLQTLREAAAQTPLVHEQMFSTCFALRLMYPDGEPVSGTNRQPPASSCVSSARTAR